MSEAKDIISSELDIINQDMPYFSFCLCSRPSNKPDGDPTCECRKNRLGKTAADSIPKVIYPASCLYTSKDDKCLTAPFDSVNNLHFSV